MTKFLTFSLIFTLGLYLGIQSGVKHYKQGCEKLSSPSGAVTWLECEVDKNE